MKALQIERAERAVQVRAMLVANGTLRPARTPGHVLHRLRHAPVTWPQDSAGYLSAAADIHHTDPAAARRIREQGSGVVADLLRQLHASDSHG